MNMESFAGLPRLVTREGERLQSSQEIRESDAGFQAGERRPHAKVNAVPECDVRVGIARNVESVGVPELLGVTVGGADHRQHELACGDDLAMHLDVASRLAEHYLDR